MTTERKRFGGTTRPPRSASEFRRTAPARLFRLDGGHVVLEDDAASRTPAAFAAIAANWSEHHVIAITGAPRDASDRTLEELGRAAQAFDRIVVCHSSRAATAACAEAAARLARAVRNAGRTTCHVVADAHRALRHCIDGMIPGDVIVYCCEDGETAARILAEYGAEAVTCIEPATGTHVALNGTTGELTAAHT
jgi:hypothetical protein